MSSPDIDYLPGAPPWRGPARDARCVKPVQAWSRDAGNLGQPRPTSAGDLAQARLFDAILQSEMAELHQIAAAIEGRWAGRPEPRHSKEFERVNARINEVRRLLDALRDRFPAM